MNVRDGRGGGGGGGMIPETKPFQISFPRHTVHRIQSDSPIVVWNVCVFPEPNQEVFQPG